MVPGMVQKSRLWDKALEAGSFGRVCGTKHFPDDDAVCTSSRVVCGGAATKVH